MTDLEEHLLNTDDAQQREIDELRRRVEQLEAELKQEILCRKGLRGRFEQHEMYGMSA